MLDRGRDDVVAAAPAGRRNAAQREVIGLGASAREDHLVRLAMEYCRHGAARVVEPFARLARLVIDARSVTPGVVRYGSIALTTRGSVGVVAAWSK